MLNMWMCFLIVIGRGNVKTSKSTTGVVIKFGCVTFKTCFLNEKTIAMWSTEAELYAIVS